MKKMQKGGVDPSKKKARLTKRATTKMEKAQKTWREAEASKADAMKSNMASDEVGTNQLYSRAQRQAERAKKLKAKASMMKNGGATKASKGVIVKANNSNVPDNTKVDKQKLNASASGGVNSNFKGVVKKATSKGSGNANTPPSKVTPSAKYGKMMKKGGSVKAKKK